MYPKKSIINIKELYHQKFSKIKNVHWTFFILVGCGGNAEKNEFLLQDGITFVSPQISYGLQNSGQLIEQPYWLSAIQATQTTPNGFLDVINSTGGNFRYSFPSSAPEYLANDIDLQGWAPVSEEVKIASRKIFNNLSEILDIQFVETGISSGNSVISIMANQQADTTGYAYSPLGTIFPTDNYLFSDVFFDLNYLNPIQDSMGTNFHYELIIHEIGHAIGLRHPFEINTGDGSLLDPIEEHNRWTLMSYSFDANYFNGEFRILDLASLVNLYGVNENYSPGNNVYSFSPWQGVIIIDGSGTDSLTAEGHLAHAYLDLRVNTHSYVGNKSEFITSAYQLSVGDSIIENAIGGSGNDWIIGNSSDNILSGRDGNDVIYAGEGKDTIVGGLGNDTIDLTEYYNVEDQVIFETDIKSNGTDKIINFKQGDYGDKINLDSFSSSNFLTQSLSPFQDQIFDISGKISIWNFQKIPTSANLKESMSSGNEFSYSSLDIDSLAIVILSENDFKGKDQHIFYMEKSINNFSIYEIAILTGDNLGLNSWSEENFI